MTKLTQHSACGSVLGCHESAPAGLIFSYSIHRGKRNIVLTQTLKPWANTTSAPAGLIFSHSIHRGKRNIVLTQTLKPLRSLRS